MTTTTVQQQARALGDPTRHAIFTHIADAAGPVTVAELNEAFPLNHNAIRQHLAKLHAAGLILEGHAPSTGRGRPRLVYELDPSAEGRWGAAGPYERLSVLLVEMIRTGLDAEEVGRRAADRFRVPSPSGDVVADITAAMARQGFEPEVRATADGAEITLRACPFAAAATTDRATVCALHLGLAEGLVEGTDAVVTELVAHDPRKAKCRLRIRVATGDEAPDAPTLSLRATSRRP